MYNDGVMIAPTLKAWGLTKTFGTGDVMTTALRDVGIGREELEARGIRIAKFGMTFPLEPRFVAEFASGLETILVIEEKRSFLELQLRESLYNLTQRPTIIGKNDEQGQVLLPATGELDPEIRAQWR